MNFGLSKDSIILAEQIRTIDKRNLKNKIGDLNNEVLKKVKEAILISCDVRNKESNLINFF